MRYVPRAGRRENESGARALYDIRRTPRRIVGARKERARVASEKEVGYPRRATPSIPREQTSAANRTLMTRVNIDQRSVYILFTLAARSAKRTGAAAPADPGGLPPSWRGTRADKLMR